MRIRVSGTDKLCIVSLLTKDDEYYEKVGEQGSWTVAFIIPDNISDTIGCMYANINELLFHYTESLKHERT